MDRQGYYYYTNGSKETATYDSDSDVTVKSEPKSERSEDTLWSIPTLPTNEQASDRYERGSTPSLSRRTSNATLVSQYEEIIKVERSSTCGSASSVDSPPRYAQKVSRQEMALRKLEAEYEKEASAANNSDSYMSEDEHTGTYHDDAKVGYKRKQTNFTMPHGKRLHSMDDLDYPDRPIKQEISDEDIKPEPQEAKKKWWWQ